MNTYDNIGYEIAKVAYDLWEKGGCIPGKDLENWLEAERIVMTMTISAEKSTAKEKQKKVAPYEKIPVELKKASPKEMKKEAPEKKVAARKTAKKTESKKEGRKTK